MHTLKWFPCVVRGPCFISLPHVECSHSLSLSISTGTIANVVIISYIFILIPSPSILWRYMYIYRSLKNILWYNILWQWIAIYRYFNIIAQPYLIFYWIYTVLDNKHNGPVYLSTSFIHETVLKFSISDVCKLNACYIHDFWDFHNLLHICFFELWFLRFLHD
jgi:hypothetical protein